MNNIYEYTYVDKSIQIYIFIYIYIYILVWARTYSCAGKLVGGLRVTAISSQFQLLFSDFESDSESDFEF